MRNIVLVFIDWFDPGYKAGGPIRSAVNFVKHMQHDHDVYVFTSDRDLDAPMPYEHIRLNEWITYAERVKVFYCASELLNRQTIAKVINDLNPAILYLNSMFSKHFTIFPLLINRRRNWRSKVVLAPRGMLRASALKFKPLKKKVYLQFFKFLGLHRHIHFQATDETEYTDIQHIFGVNAQVTLAPNWPGYIPPYSGSPIKKPGELSIVFVGRIHPIKNLYFLLECLLQVKGKLKLTVIGSEEDKTFANRCRDLVATFPDTIHVDFKGEVPNQQIAAIIARHHIMGLPTHGENFGHAIFEALSIGRPVLISDQTPWRNLQDTQAGWDLPLESRHFVSKLQLAADLEQAEYNRWSIGAWEHVRKSINQEQLKITYQKLFN